jgi:segregation and condensation protein A
VAYAVRLAVFEGPLDLLLHLIRGQKLDIWDIPIAQITEQYLETLALMETLDLEVGGEFVLMSATLMELKSRLLLPRPEPVVDTEEGPDPRAELVERLLEYEQFQKVAEQLRELAAEAGRTFERLPLESWEGAPPLEELRPSDLWQALTRLRDRAVREATPPLRLHVRREAHSLAQRLADLRRRLAAATEPLRFSALLTPAPLAELRRELIVLFLAILELARTGELLLRQDSLGDEIYLERPQLAT